MSWSYINGARATSGSANGTSLSLSPNLNIAAGDLLVAITNWNGAVGATPGVRSGAGENDHTMRSTTDLTDHHIAVGYKISATANSNATMEFTLDSARKYRSCTVLQFRPDSGDTVALDTAAVVATGSSDTFSSNSIDPTGTDNIVVGFVGLYTARTVSTFNIGESAATQPSGGDSYEVQQGYRLFTSEQGSMDADIVLGGTSQYAIELLSFKATAAAGGGSIVVQAMYHYRRHRD